MTKTFVQTREFSKNWDKLGFDDDDLRKLELMIMYDPRGFPVIRGTGGLRKLRFSFEGKGKSGSVRVCYVNFVIEETIYLITVYPKGMKDNLTREECNDIRKKIVLLRHNLRKR